MKGDFVLSRFSLFISLACFVSSPEADHTEGKEEEEETVSFLSLTVSSRGNDFTVYVAVVVLLMHWKASTRQLHLSNVPRLGHNRRRNFTTAISPTRRRLVEVANCDRVFFGDRSRLFAVLPIVPEGHVVETGRAERTLAVWS